ncbi:MAG: Uma2 family endonuclease, partial [Crocosphaera sp.]
MIMQTEKQQTYTLQEYLDLEIKATDRRLQEYILIEQYRPHIEQFTKTESGQWLLSDYDGQDATLTLNSVSLEIPLLDIYDKVNFQNKDT